MSIVEKRMCDACGEAADISYAVSITVGAVKPNVASARVIDLCETHGAILVTPLARFVEQHGAAPDTGHQKGSAECGICGTWLSGAPSL